MEKNLQSLNTRKKLEELYDSTELSVYDMFQNFSVFSTRRSVARFLTHYELFKKVYELPGSIVELGVYRGGGLFTWLKLIEIFCPTDILKKVYGFDTFEGFPSIAKEDGAEDEGLDRKVGGYFGGSSIENDLGLAYESYKQDKFIRDVERLELIKGDACETIPKFVEEKGYGFKISLLNLDLDLYNVTKVALEQFVPRMVKGGIIVLDEYAHETFGGETKAIDDYWMENFGKKPQINKFHWHTNPSGYIIID